MTKSLPVNRALWVVALLSLPSLAAEPVATVTQSVAVPSDARFALSIASASLVSISSSVLGGVIATGVPNFCTVQYGAPRPLCGVAGIALAGATQLLVSLLAIPELFRINGNDPGAIRAGWWSWARWPAAALAISALVVLAGGLSEQKAYGTGQGTLLGGFGGAAVTGITVDVLGLVGAVRAAKAQR